MTLARAGDVSDELFSLLCTLGRFDLDGNPDIDQKTLAGYLACNFTNLKDQTTISVHGMRLEGAFVEPVQYTRT